MKKIVGVVLISMVMVVLSGCNKASKSKEEIPQEAIEDTELVDISNASSKSIKKTSEMVRQEIEVIKKKVLKIQANGSLSKEEKAKQISGLQAELQQKMKESLGK